MIIAPICPFETRFGRIGVIEGYVLANIVGEEERC